MSRRFFNSSNKAYYEAFKTNFSLITKKCIWQYTYF